MCGVCVQEVNMQSKLQTGRRIRAAVTTAAIAALSCGMSLTPSQPALAQSGGYQVGETGTTDPATVSANATAGPVRMARFSFIQGCVTWRADASVDWATAPANLPLRQGAQVWVANGGRAEIQFDDGSYLRLGGGAIATLQSLYSDDQGEFTQIKLSNGLSMMTVKHSHSVYQIDTPLLSMKTTGPSRVRVGVAEGSEVGVVEGGATVEAPQGTETLAASDYLNLASASAPMRVRALPNADSWELWNEQRDAQINGTYTSLAQHGVPDNITLVAGDLDSYGTWQNDPQYGQVWCPRVADPTWRPYYAGHWVWVNPFGWTWVSDEPWGWAPYHYGTWYHASFGWAWRPGPRTQYWCPAVVHFTECNGSVAWCPLAPSEVRYPTTLALGFRAGNWSAFFSIGQAACYYPAGPAYCLPRPYNTVVINKITYVNNVTVINNGMRGGVGFVSNNNRYLEQRNFVPVNARIAGVTTVSEAGFGGHGSYRPVSQGTTLFTNGRTIAAPASGSMPTAGPIGVRPSIAALQPTRTFVKPASETPAFINRPVFGAPSAPGRTPVGPGRGSISETVTRAREVIKVPSAGPGRTVSPPSNPRGGDPNPPRRNPDGGPGRTTGGDPNPPRQPGPRGNPHRRIGGPLLVRRAAHAGAASADRAKRATRQSGGDGGPQVRRRDPRRERQSARQHH